MSRLTTCDPELDCRRLEIHMLCCHARIGHFFWAGDLSSRLSYRFGATSTRCDLAASDQFSNTHQTLHRLLLGCGFAIIHFADPDRIMIPISKGHEKSHMIHINFTK